MKTIREELTVVFYNIEEVVDFLNGKKEFKLDMLYQDRDNKYICKVYKEYD